ncbi:MAG: hypothetical protein O7C75_20505 [Verrucomicrobia bacterium]|nr:hypothetical protein [Verrucomicrobiota bacterium]
MSGKIHFIPLNGLCNRMRAIASAKVLADDIGSKLRVVWAKDPGLQTKFGELFEDFQDITLSDLTDSSFLVTKFQFALVGRTRISLLRKLIRRRYEFVLESLDTDTLRNPNQINQMKGKQVVITSFAKFYLSESLNFSMFKPLPDISKRIKDFAGENFNEHTVGVHIRMGDNPKSKHHSPTSKFVSLLDERIKEDDSFNFFLSTDCRETEKLFYEKYRGRISVTQKELSRHTTSGMQSAVIDLFLLSKTKKILGSYYSTFSTTAAEIGTIQKITVR